MHSCAQPHCTPQLRGKHNHRSGARCHDILRAPMDVQHIMGPLADINSSGAFIGVFPKRWCPRSYRKAHWCLGWDIGNNLARCSNHGTTAKSTSHQNLILRDIDDIAVLKGCLQGETAQSLNRTVAMRNLAQKGFKKSIPPATLTTARKSEAVTNDGRRVERHNHENFCNKKWSVL